MNIKPELNLNKHPKDCENLSLVSAKNMMLSKDMSCLTNEISIDSVIPIMEGLLQDFKGDWNILGYIPCNDEVVLFVRGTKQNDTDPTDVIYRYSEKLESCVPVNSKWKWSGGKIKGTFTYNVENNLIITVAEYGVDGIDIPLKTINLGHFDEDGTIADNYDNTLTDAHYPISPEVLISKFYEHKYVSGSAYKGWYYMFIRYKINESDYTQWFNLGYPIFVDTLIKQEIFRYCYPQEYQLTIPDPFKYFVPTKNTLSDAPDGYCAGCTDSFSNTSDIATETFSFNIYHEYSTKTNYKYYQLGIICASKSYTKSWRTSDINIESNTFKFDIKQLIESDVQTFIEENYNYFNVKNVINYKNRLYISNYKEHGLNNVKLDDDISKYVNVRLKSSYFSYYGKDKNPFVTSIILYNKDLANNNSTQYFINSPLGRVSKIPMNIYLNIDEDTKLSVIGPNNGELIAYDIPAKNCGISNRTSIPAYCSFYYTTGETTKTVTGKVFVKILNKEGASYSVINLDQLIMTSSVLINDPNNNFDARRTNTTLIPGEVYNLFVHFVDKYGHVTNGYRLSNETYITISGESKETGTYFPLKFYNYYDATKPICYAAIPEGVTMKQIYDVISEGGSYRVFTSLNNNVLSGELTMSSVNLKNSLIAEYGKILSDSNYNYLEPFQCYNTGTDSNFGIYINNNGERLFRIPDKKYQQTNSLVIYGLDVTLMKLPENYVGYFISYEKFESLAKVTGFLTRCDFRTMGGVTVGSEVTKLGTANQEDSSNMFLYSSKFDISDSLQLNYNILKTELIQVTHTGENGDIFTPEIANYDRQFRNICTTYCYDYNKALLQMTKDSIINKVYAMPNYSLVVADSVKENRAGVGSGLMIDSIDHLFDNNNGYTDEDKVITVYIATVYNHTKNLYMSKNKSLIKLTDIMYLDDPTDVYMNANGFITYDGVIVYENPGLYFNTSDHTARRRRGSAKDYYPKKLGQNEHIYEGNIPILNYVQFPVYDTYFYESKKFNNSPQPYEFPIVGISGESNESNKSYWAGNIVEPKNSIDLFSNPQGSKDDFNVKTYSNYREDILSVEEFNKTVRRSNVIQDETRVNAWRTFPVEGYKNITENKGIITNLVGIGTYLLVHTEHSLFMFNQDATLKTEDKDIQLSQPDAFDVDYTEVFTSDHGYGGLQDDRSFIVDQFGYIFYNNDFNHLYQFDNGQLKLIDANIVHWLSKYKPTNVRFCNDKFNNRLLIKFDCHPSLKSEFSEVLSYHYDAGAFISLHDYYFTDAFNTKTVPYMLHPDGWIDPTKKVNLYTFIEHLGVHDESHLYCWNPDVMINNNCASEQFKVDDNTCKSYISIIINSEYQVIQLLEFIKYNLRKIKDENRDFTLSPVEDMQVPYAGDIIRIFNDMCDSGNLDVSVNVYNPGDYKKPWFELGNWNFNYFRNDINKPNPTAKDIYTRLYGNYFVIRFIFNNTDHLRIEFEELDGSVVKNRKL